MEISLTEPRGCSASLAICGELIYLNTHSSRPLMHTVLCLALVLDSDRSEPQWEGRLPCCSPA